ncbi:proline-rich receptor-like protein kinase PERK14 isoform X2 [Mastacembelus armatus]|uniref:proline-rich receptor-like protein kinase PERK14 isoform X2 n=1 Tax=Mastacembelus armatus TaxID=205130 RepID=UPI000E45946F|nr:proline-rich receptor-like protein kinase PERK14 isoform X2 [Mastacembelus armatus]
MIIVLLLSSFTIMVSAVPVRPNVFLHLLSQREPTQAQRVQPVEATNHKPQTLANVEQPQPGVPQPMDPQGSPQTVPSLQQYSWPPLGGSPMIVPVQPSVYGFLPANQPALPQQPLIFPHYGYLPLFSSPHTNQFSPYGFPVIRDAAFPPTPENPAPNSPVLPAETPSGTAPSRDTLQTMQQPQNPQIVYMVQQPMSSPPGALSSEEIQMASKMNQLGVYMSTVLTNLPAGAGLPVNQAAGLSNPEQEGNVPNIGTPSAGVSQQGLTGCGPQPNANSVPVGLEKAAQNVATVQTPVHPKPQPAKRNHI